MLLLRATAGLTAILQGVGCLVKPDQQTATTIVASLVALGIGAFLLIGFFTPVAAGLVGFASMGIALSLFPTPAQNLLDARLPAFFVAIISAAIVFLGPGAFSLDARLFGHREISIPPVPRPPGP